jgi:enediyne biosynthesis protein E3
VTTFLRAARRRLLTPSTSQTLLSVRGFHVKDAQSRELLESVGGHFLQGYGYAAESARGRHAEVGLEGVPSRFRGFAYEGAAMGFAMVDGFFGGHRLAQFLEGRAQDHLYMSYVGIGWAMARLPRFRWPRLEFDPLLRWLVLDGYGFHQAYFRTRRYIRECYREERFPWPADDPGGYAGRAIDQGIGRALWFVAGTDPAQAAIEIGRFPQARRPDLFAGVGLAATYAGGATSAELRELLRLAAPYRCELAQGAAFAAEAAKHAGIDAPHAEIGTRVFCDATVTQAAKVVINTMPDARTAATPSDPPAYEVWRRRIAAEFVPAGRS